MFQIVFDATVEGRCTENIPLAGERDDQRIIAVVEFVAVFESV
jgi:hypothetical protein